MILFKLDHGVDEETDSTKSYVIGGFSSDSWVSGSSGNGDSSNFLFNLTLNLRFNAREGLPYYQMAGQDFMRFGNTDMVIRDNFNSITSRMALPPPD